MGVTEPKRSKWLLRVAKVSAISLVTWILFLLLATIIILVAKGILDKNYAVGFISPVVAIILGVFLYRQERINFYTDRISDLRARLLRNFRFTPLLPIFVEWRLLGPGVSLPKEPKRVSDIAAQASMTMPMHWDELQGQLSERDPLRSSEIPDDIRGGILLWCMGRLQLADPSVKVNWISGQVQYKPDIKTMSVNELESWAIQYQVTMSGLEWAWSVNKVNLRYYIGQFVKAPEFSQILRDVSATDLDEKLELFINNLYDNFETIDMLRVHIDRLRRFGSIIPKG